MKALLKNLSSMLNKRQKQYLYILAFFSIFLAFVETISLSSLVGFLILISDPELVAQKIPIEYLKNLFLSLSLNQLAIYSSIILVCVFLLKNLILLLFYYFQEKIVKNIYINLAKDIFRIYLNLPYQFHVDQNPAITIQSVNGETKRVTDYIVNLSLIFKESITVIFLFIMMFLVNMKITFLLFIFMLISTILFYKSIAAKIKSVGIQVRVSAENILQKITEAVSSIKIVKLTNKNEFFVQNVFKHMARRQNNEIIFRIVGRLPRLILEVLAVILVVLILLFFLFQNLSIKESIPILSLVCLIIIRTLPACININTNLNNLRFNTKSVENISNLYKNINLDNKTKIQKSKIDVRKIDIKDLTFKYENKIILNKVNYKFEKGKIYGLKGESGSGKTTLIDLILGLIKPINGEIYINDKNIFKENIYGNNYASYVPQDIYLSDNSIAENIAFGLKKEEINHKKLENILERSELLNFINKLPNGYKTQIGDKGAKLSGGQRQRIGFARALYHDSSLLVLDEATSALDVDMENKIIKEVEKLKKEKIIILVAHRIKTLDVCDEIITLSNSELTKV